MGDNTRLAPWILPQTVPAGLEEMVLEHRWQQLSTEVKKATEAGAVAKWTASHSSKFMGFIIQLNKIIYNNNINNNNSNNNNSINNNNKYNNKYNKYIYITTIYIYMCVCVLDDANLKLCWN